MALARKTLEELLKQDPNEAKAFWAIVKQSERLVDDLASEMLHATGRKKKKLKKASEELITDQQVIPFPQKKNALMLILHQC